MAHTLKAYYFPASALTASAVTIDFLSALVPNTTGVALDGYGMGMPGVVAARSSSAAADNPRLTYSKHETVVETLTLQVQGTNYTQLFTQLHQLARLGEYARLAMENPYARSPAYLEFKTGNAGAGETLYAAIFDARLELPETWGKHVDATNTIQNVTLTIERELWRDTAPTLAQGAAYPAIGSTYVNGATGWANSAAIANIGGDTKALGYLKISAPLTTLQRAVFGYRSQALGGANYASLGKTEAESATLGTDTTAVADAAASGGNVARCTFATATLQKRLSGANVPHGTHRVFVRMKVDAGTTALVNVAYQDDPNAWTSGDYTSNPALTITNSAFLVYDLGLIRFGGGTGSLALKDGTTGGWSIFASRSAGAGNLNMDYVFIMPTEGCVQAAGLNLTFANGYAWSFDEIGFNGNAAWVYVSAAGTLMRVRNSSWSGALNLQPGNGRLYWLLGDEVSGYISPSISAIDPLVYLTAVSRFLAPVKL